MPFSFKYCNIVKFRFDRSFLLSTPSQSIHCENSSRICHVSILNIEWNWLLNWIVIPADTIEATLQFGLTMKINNENVLGVVSVIFACLVFPRAPSMASHWCSAEGRFVSVPFDCHLTTILQFATASCHDRPFLLRHHSILLVNCYFCYSREQTLLLLWQATIDGAPVVHLHQSRRASPCSCGPNIWAIWEAHTQRYLPATCQLVAPHSASTAFHFYLLHPLNSTIFVVRRGILLRAPSGTP